MPQSAFDLHSWVSYGVLRLGAPWDIAPAAAIFADDLRRLLCQSAVEIVVKRIRAVLDCLFTDTRRPAAAPSLHVAVLHEDIYCCAGLDYTTLDYYINCKRCSNAMESTVHSICPI